MKTFSLFNKGNKLKLFKGNKNLKDKENNEYFINDEKFTESFLYSEVEKK